MDPSRKNSRRWQAGESKSGLTRFGQRVNSGKRRPTIAAIGRLFDKDVAMHMKGFPSRSSAPTGVEAIGAFVVLSVIVLAQMLAAGAFYLVRRDFWVDELFTYTLVADPDLGHAFRALAGGVETHPPAFYLMLRGFTALTGGANEVTLRLFALLSILVGLGGIYALLRQSFSPLVCFAALLAVWSHPLIVFHAFEARFYGPWLAGVVWFAYFLVRCRETERSRLWDVLVGVTAIYVCTIHYFGIVTLGLVLGFELLARRAGRLSLWQGIPPAALGPLALAACLPLLLRQRAAMTVPTWVESAGLGWSFEFLGKLLFPGGLAAVVVVAWLARLMRGELWPARDMRVEGFNLKALAGLSGLLLLPLVLIAFSFTVQSVLIEKYALPALAGLAPAAAYAMARTTRTWQVLLCAILCLTGIRELHQYTQQRRDHDGRFTAGLIDNLRRNTGDADVIFETQHNLYVVCRYAPDLAGRCYFLDYEPGQIGNDSHFRVFSRDLARRYDAYYPVFGMKKWEELRERPSFYLVPTFLGSGKKESQTAQPYPGFDARFLNSDLYEMVRKL